MNKNSETVKYVLFLAVLGYFTVDSISILVNHGWPFETIQWFLAAVTLACIALFFILAKKLYYESRKDK